MFPPIGCNPNAEEEAQRRADGQRYKDNKSGEEILTIAFKPSDKKIKGEIEILLDKDGNPQFRSPETLALRIGEVKVGGKSFALFIPEKGPFSLKNTGGSNHLGNTATPLFIDSDLDGEPESKERWFTNLPVRIGDKMFQVVAIAEDGGSIQVNNPRLKARALWGQGLKPM